MDTPRVVVIEMQPNIPLRHRAVIRIDGKSRTSTNACSRCIDLALQF